MTQAEVVTAFFVRSGCVTPTTSTCGKFLWYRGRLIAMWTQHGTVEVPCADAVGRGERRVRDMYWRLKFALVVKPVALDREGVFPQGQLP